MLLKTSGDQDYEMRNLFSTILNHRAFELSITALVCVSCVPGGDDNLPCGDIAQSYLIWSLSEA